MQPIIGFLPGWLLWVKPFAETEFWELSWQYFA